MIDEWVTAGRGNLRKSMTERFLSGGIFAQKPGGILGGRLAKNCGALDDSILLLRKC